MRILYITYTGLTEELGRSQILQYILALRKEGLEFEIVSFEPPIEFSTRTVSLLNELSEPGIRFHFVNRQDGRAAWRRIGAVCQAIVRCIQVCLNTKIDAIHCRNAFAAECALFINSLTRIPILFDMRGFWGDARRETRRWDPDTFGGRWVYAIWKAREASYLRRASLINCLTEKTKAWILSGSYQDAERIIVTPCCVDFSSADDAVSAAMSRDNSVFTCLYIGSRGGVYDDVRLLETFASIRQEIPDARLLLIGQGNSTQIIDEARRSGLSLDESAVEVTSLPHGSLFASVAHADVGLSFCQAGFSAKGVSSTKIGEYLALGIPVICNEAIGDVKELFDDIGGGLVLADGDNRSKEALQIREFVRDLNKIDRVDLRHRARKRLDTAVAVANYRYGYECLQGRTKSKP